MPLKIQIQLKKELILNIRNGEEHKAVKFFSLEVLGQPASSSCCDRNWRKYGFIHSSEGNKLTPARAADLVFTHNNYRLLSRRSQPNQSGPSRMRDIGGEMELRVLLVLACLKVQIFHLVNQI